jgi:pimeloyl-ACP methyl ester carboxylesterase
MPEIAYRTADVDGVAVFYREAGPRDAPALLLLHGFPSASHMFRELISLLADRFHIVAPDLPGFGKSAMPPRDEFEYTFEHIAAVISRLTEVLGLGRFALYVFDYGAPVGFRVAARHPERVTAIVSQNGNAYEEGLSDAWNPVQVYWKEPSAANREAIRIAGGTRDDRLAVHARRSGPGAGQPGRLRAGQLLPHPSRRGRDPA